MGIRELGSNEFPGCPPPGDWGLGMRRVLRHLDQEEDKIRNSYVFV